MGIVVAASRGPIATLDSAEEGDEAVIEAIIHHSIAIPCVDGEFQSGKQQNKVLFEDLCSQE